jgi:hypothetical protein
MRQRQERSRSLLMPLALPTPIRVLMMSFVDLI